MFAMTRSEAAAATVLACSVAIEKVHQKHSTPSNGKSPNTICVFHDHVRVYVIAQYIDFVDSASRGLSQICHSIACYEINTYVHEFLLTNWYHAKSHHDTVLHPSNLWVSSPFIYLFLNQASESALIGSEQATYSIGDCLLRKSLFWVLGNRGCVPV